LNLLWYAVLGPPAEGEGLPPTTPTSTSSSSPSSLPPSPPLKRSVMELTVEAIISLLLKQGDIPIVLARYLKRCVFSLQHSRRVPSTLYLLHKLSEEQPLVDPYHHHQQQHQQYLQQQQQQSPRPVAKVARAKLLSYLSEVAGEGGVFVVILEGLKSYRERARAAAVAKGLLRQAPQVGRLGEVVEEEEDVVMEAVLGREGGSGLTYREEVAARLDFMRYVAENSEREWLLMFRPHLLPLWEMMVLNPLCKGEREMLFEWLTSLAPNGGGGGGGGGGRGGQPPATALELFRGCWAGRGAEVRR